uniref:ATP synthase complex subunit 8 n=1 Tax=Culcita novaeguineae TaxID=31170 RepID=A0A7S8CUJ9_CULNO|nr:ATP synthase F0 subunit 8 [Culcita novaeguineae]QPC56412.1 ATP synthase F0 subunit 8 [Culcita novaeguineae]
MPQLNLAWWLFNFFIGWLSLLIVLTILLNSPRIAEEPNANVTSNSVNPNNWKWN